MNKRKVSEEEQVILIKNLEQKWDIEMGKHYWYPLGGEVTENLTINRCGFCNDSRHITECGVKRWLY
ncbi:hypothetical protein NDK43_25510 [Neobacillus pocheonensis]|uniref:Uncharacterized protein n=1 Tax=Neobacillus pocheonensis TaxID=363869 RepID=A0ABT0WFI2_9BACI|nr:hypothetical protein [Neobacillus pocheonensis]